MKVKIELTEKEKRIALVVAVILVLVLYYWNRIYIMIMDVEFEDNKPTKLLIKTGFLLPVRTIIELKNIPTEQKVKMYGYTIKAEPLKDSSGKLSGEYHVNIFTSDSFLFGFLSDKKKPFKSLVIHKDEYYVQYYKTPLGRI